jgi:hypothetical protein
LLGARARRRPAHLPDAVDGRRLPVRPHLRGGRPRVAATNPSSICARSP